jgi:pyruvate/2-oxoglutarate dehydrogenase complex dihydrolipoamide dehydrogenase (E3) component/uncharacterized membrane protein YdjX (TVP38/TMEM64 family)
MLKKLILIMAIIAIIAGVKVFGLDQYLTFDYIKQNQDLFARFYAGNQYLTIGLYFGIYVLSTALSIPGATVLTLLGGALFGLPLGLLIISFASSLGATFAFIISRTLLRDTIQKKYASSLKGINEGIEKEGAFYLFTLRLVPIFPFFLINLAMGLTKLSTIKFFIVSQLGMLAGTAVFVNAGVELGKLDSLAGIMSPALLGSFAILGIFPLVAKKIIEYIKAKKVYKKWKKPKSFDYNMIAIGGGSAGLVTSYISAAVKAKVALIEKESMGGDCLNTGCVPSKALIRSAKVAYSAKNGEEFGVSVGEVKIDFAQAMNRVQNVIKEIEPHDSIERYTELGVDCIKGEAEVISPWEVKVNGKILTTKNITIATGASPFVPPIKGLDKVEFLTSNNLWSIRELPKDFVVLGGGPIGLEMAQSFARFGSNVHVIEMGPRILPREDEDVSVEVTKKLEKEGLHVLLKHKAVEFIKKDGRDVLVCETSEGNIEIPFDKVLVAVGRKANIKGFGLESLDIELRGNGTIAANDYLQTNYPNIFVCGDVTGPYQLTHTAAHQAWYCAVNGLFGKFKKFKVDYSVIPWCTYVDPEVATVGKNELVCKEEGLEYDVTKYGIDDLDRAIADSTNYGFVKVLTNKGSDKIIGATIVGTGAGELLIEFVTNMKYGKGLNDILGTIHSYPTMAEANKYAAGIWKKANAPESLLKWVEKFHQWSR